MCAEALLRSHGACCAINTHATSTCRYPAARSMRTLHNPLDWRRKVTRMRTRISMFVVAVVLVLPVLATAQEAPALSNDSGTALLQDQTPSTGSGTDKAQQPPAAVGEEGKKPTRGFFSALGHNLADDVKHIPRLNSVYWMAGGAGLPYAVHPIDHTLNARLVGHSNPFVAGDY